MLKMSEKKGSNELSTHCYLFQYTDTALTAFRLRALAAPLSLCCAILRQQQQSPWQWREGQLRRKHHLSLCSNSSLLPPLFSTWKRYLLSLSSLHPFIILVSPLESNSLLKCAIKVLNFQRPFIPIYKFKTFQSSRSNCQMGCVLAD